MRYMNFDKIPVNNYFLFFYLFIQLACSLNTAQAQVDTVINRYRQYLFRVYQPASEDIELWTSSLNSSSQWPDIDYADTGPSKWKIQEHLDRVRQLAIAWAKPESDYFQNEKVWKTASLALDLWLEKRYRNANWWHNEIGIPRYMRDIIIALHDKMSKDQLKVALDILGQYKVIDSGGNLAWSADLGIHYAALTKDTEKIDRYVGRIIKDIRLNTREGVQPDYSFHQHGAHLQMYQYGEAFLVVNARLAWQLRNTPWAFPKDKIDVLADFALKGWQWMARGVNTVPGTMDRSATRIGELRSADLRELLPFLSELVPEKAGEFQAMADRQNGKGHPLTGYRYYPYSDFTSYQRNSFSFFLKTISTRTLATESINHENLKGHLLNSGDAYLIRNGNEYYNLMPLWNWEKLPGVTNFQGKGNIHRLPYSGNVSNDKSGLAVMDYFLEDTASDQSLSAHKIWASYNDVVVCLIADMQIKYIESDIFTDLDQCRWQGEVTVNSPDNILKSGTHHLDNVRWIHHSGFAYIPLTPSTIDLTLETKTGTWTSINLGETTDSLTGKIFMPVMIHKNFRQGLSTGYVLALCNTSRKAKKLANNPSWKILRNDKDCQAVSFGDKTVMAAFFSPATLKITEKDNLQVDKSCAIMLVGNKLYISDPAHTGETVHVTWNNKGMDIPLQKNGTTIEKELP